MYIIYIYIYINTCIYIYIYIYTYIVCDRSESNLNKSASKNVVNLCKWKLSNSKISLLSKRLKFVPVSSNINKGRRKMELEAYGRMLRLKWHFPNDEKELDRNKFKPKSTFNP